MNVVYNRSLSLVSILEAKIDKNTLIKEYEESVQSRIRGDATYNNFKDEIKQFPTVVEWVLSVCQNDSIHANYVLSKYVKREVNYIENTFGVASDLRVYRKFSNVIKLTKKLIDYTPTELHELIEPYKYSIKNNAYDYLIRNKELISIGSTQDYDLYQVKTVHAAVYVGRGTGWCVSYTSDGINPNDLNMYYKYFPEGTKSDMIAILPKVDRFKSPSNTFLISEKIGMYNNGKDEPLKTSNWLEQISHENLAVMADIINRYYIKSKTIFNTIKLFFTNNDMPRLIGIYDALVNELKGHTGIFKVISRTLGINAAINTSKPFIINAGKNSDVDFEPNIVFTFEDFKTFLSRMDFKIKDAAIKNKILEITNLDRDYPVFVETVRLHDTHLIPKVIVTDGSDFNDLLTFGAEILRSYLENVGRSNLVGSRSINSSGIIPNIGIVRVYNNDVLLFNRDMLSYLKIHRRDIDQCEFVSNFPNKFSCEVLSGHYLSPFREIYRTREFELYVDLKNKKCCLRLSYEIKTDEVEELVHSVLRVL